MATGTSRSAERTQNNGVVTPFCLEVCDVMSTVFPTCPCRVSPSVDGLTCILAHRSFKSRAVIDGVVYDKRSLCPKHSADGEHRARGKGGDRDYRAPPFASQEFTGPRQPPLS